jgi:L-2,4-diaminobutyric acid acetyltransferase
LDTQKSQLDDNIIFRNPTTNDGKYFWEIAKASKTLDVNSTYHYLIMCRHFAKTCLAAEKNGQVIGFVTAYIPPNSPDTVFVWQVAVDERHRGQGLGVQMLVSLYKNLKILNIKNLEATITPSNHASIKLFTAVARELKASFEFEKDFFSATHFGENVHEPEILFHIDPEFSLTLK